MTTRYKTHGKIEFGLVENATGQAQSLEEILDSVVGDGLPDASYALGASADGWVSRTPVDRGADIVSVREFGVVDTSSDNATAFQKAVDKASSGGFSLWVPPTSTYYAIQSPIYMKSGVRIYGAGHYSHIRQTRSNATPSGSQFAFMFGAYYDALITSTTGYAISSVTAPAYSVTCSTAGDAANFAVGDVCLLRTAEGVTVNSDLKPNGQMINEVSSVNATTGAIGVVHPIIEDFGGTGPEIVNLGNNGGTDSLGNDLYAPKDCGLYDLRITTVNERWTGFGGNLRTTLRGLETDASAFLSANGWAFANISDCRAFIWSSGIELAAYAHDNVINNVRMYYKENSAASKGPFVVFDEQARRNSATGIEGHGSSAHSPQQLIFVNLGNDNTVKGARFWGSAPSVGTVTIDATSGTASRNLIEDVIARALSGMGGYHARIVLSSGGAADENVIRDCKFYGTPTSGSVRVDGNRNEIINNYFDVPAASGLLISSGATDNVLRGNRTNLSTGMPISDSGTATISRDNHGTGAQRSGAVRRWTLADDDFVSFKPTSSSGMILINYAAATASSGMFMFNVAGSAPTEKTSGATNFQLGTGALTQGTSDGTDAKFNFNVNSSDGRIYLKNRTGSQIALWVVDFS